MRRKPAPTAGFTLVELLAAIAILSLVVGSAIWGLNMLNYYASLSRCYTAAQTLAQNQIDVILTRGPYDPVGGNLPSPNILRTDATYYTNPADGSISTSATGSYIVPIYKDPKNGNQIVTGTIATTVKDAGVAWSGTNLNVRQATVTVTFTFRQGKGLFKNGTYTVTMNTMRSPDV
jgi:prepilin-type N-terminal cleavage/methylation domain-containing protein